MINEKNSSFTNVTINEVDPIANVYQAQEAYNIQQLQSDFSPFVSISKNSVQIWMNIVFRAYWYYLNVFGLMK